MSVDLLIEWNFVLQFERTINFYLDGVDVNGESTTLEDHASFEAFEELVVVLGLDVLVDGKGEGVFCLEDLSAHIMAFSKCRRLIFLNSVMCSLDNWQIFFVIFH